MATKRLSSAVWDYFTVIPNRQEIAKCNICNAEIRRGSAGSSCKSFSTKSLWGHLKAKHKDEQNLAEEKQGEEMEKKEKVRKLQEDKSEIYVLQGIASSSKQLTLVEAMDSGKKWDSRYPDQIEGEKLLTYWLCDSLNSYKTVENDRFKKVACHLSKRFKVPSEKVLRTKHIPGFNEKVQYAIKNLLTLNTSQNGTYSITTDIWSSPSKVSFMSVTAHWITKDFKRKLAVLRCIRYNTAHTASNLSSSLKNICNDWGLNNVHVMVTDNANNMVLAAKNAGYQTKGCFCHILHLVVHHSVLEQNGVKLMINR